MHQLRSDAIALFEQGRAEEIIRANVPLAFHPDHASDLVLTACIWTWCWTRVPTR